jgi:hypothetical protein
MERPGQASSDEGTGGSAEENDMPKTTRMRHRIATTVGELLAAAWDVTPGLGAARAQRVAVLLAVSPIAHKASRRIQFER